MRQLAARFWRFLTRTSCLVGWPRRRLPAAAGSTVVLAGPPSVPVEGMAALETQLRQGAAAPLERLAARGVVIAARIDRAGADGPEFCALLHVMPACDQPQATALR